MDDGLCLLEVGDRERPAQATDVLCLKPPSAKPSLIAAQVFVQTVPNWISRLTRRLMLMSLVKMPAERPSSVALARFTASASVSNTSKVATGPKTSFCTMSVLTSSTSSSVGR